MMKSTLSILLIEDNLALAKQICQLMEGKGWQVDYSSNGKLGLSLALQNTYDVIVLDLNLPDIDGFQVCENIKREQRRKTPILMLTARDAFSDKAKGFMLGTDDYLTKPCDLRELAIRCEALSRRHDLHSNTRMIKGGLIIDLRSHEVLWNNNHVNVTKTGFKILKLLTEAYPYPVTRSDLISGLWGKEPPETNALKAHLYNLRKALEKVSEPPKLQTISNLGYRLVGLEQDD